MSHIQLNYAFLLFWRISAWNSLKKSLFSPKIDHIRDQKYTENLFFSTSLKSFKYWTKFGYVRNNYFCSNLSKWENIKKKKISPQNEPHTAKLCLPLVLTYFRGNSQKHQIWASEHLSEMVNFMTKDGSFPWIFPKIRQNHRKAEFSCMWLILRKKNFG